MTTNNKTTHTMHDVEGLILERLEKLRDSKDKKEQTKLKNEILKLEKHFNDCNDRHINGKKYPVRKKPQPVSKEELYKLIDSVPDMDSRNLCTELDIQDIDVTGVFI